MVKRPRLGIWALMEEVCRGREVRIGQKEVVKIYWLKLVQEGSEKFNIDSFITDKADTKRELAAEFLSWSHSAFRNLD